MADRFYGAYNVDPQSGVTLDMDNLLQFFDYEHLPPHLQQVSKPFGDMARMLSTTLPHNPESTTCLRMLLQAKDCAVRAVLFKAPNRPTDRK